MAVKIKLLRMGKIRAPQYRIVIADARTKRDGRFIEAIGKYHPTQEPSLIEVDSARVQHWLSVGAQPTTPVQAILRVTGDWQRFKGEPGAEGTLRVAPPPPDKRTAFEAAAREAGDEPRAASTSRPRAGTPESRAAQEAAGATREREEQAAVAQSGGSEAGSDASHGASDQPATA